MKKVITIGREFGSGGREIGRRIAEKLQIAYYDQEIVTEISKRTRLSEEYVERIIPPAAQAENDAMAELSGEQQAELIRLTDLFSEQMRLKFQSINKNTL